MLLRQDKWRNISVTAMYGSRKKAKLALKKNPSSHDDDNATALTIVALANGVHQHISSPPLAVSCLPPPRDYEGLFTRFLSLFSFVSWEDSFEHSKVCFVLSVDEMILEAITNFKRHLGPDGKSILLYVEVILFLLLIPWVISILIIKNLVCLLNFFFKEKHNMQPDMKRLVTSRLKHLVNVGTIVKVRNITLWFCL